MKGVPGLPEIVSTQKQLHDFIDDLEKCLNHTFEEAIDCDNIILCGMGGSAISGNVVADYCLSYSEKPIAVIMDARIPKWVNKRTLMVISSYSGNTLETLESYKQSLSIGCKRIVITSGGILEKLARKNNDMLIMLPDNLHPRHSIGYMIGYIFGVMKSTGSLKDIDISHEIINNLRSYRNQLEDKDNGPAMILARKLLGQIPVICSYSYIQSVVFRWKTQFNENSKYVAFCSTFEDFSIFESEGWLKRKEPDYSLVIIVNSKDDLEQGEIASIVKRLDGNNVDYTVIELNGESDVENTFKALMLGDYVSMYMAEIRGVDPSGVPPITLLKQKLKPTIDDCVKSIL